jgi:hypothetical protein
MAVLHNTLYGNLALATDAATPTYLDVSNWVTSFVVAVTVDQVEVPTTMATDKTTRPGSKVYTVTLNYLNDAGSNTVHDFLWTAATTGDGYLNFHANLFDGATSVTNPQWSGTFVVSAAETGGDMGAIGSSSATFTLTGAPTKSIT